MVYTGKIGIKNGPIAFFFLFLPSVKWVCSPRTRARGPITAEGKQCLHHQTEKIAPHSTEHHHLSQFKANFSFSKLNGNCSNCSKNGVDLEPPNFYEPPKMVVKDLQCAISEDNTSTAESLLGEAQSSSIRWGKPSLPYYTRSPKLAFGVRDVKWRSGLGQNKSTIVRQVTVQPVTYNGPVSYESQFNKT